MAVNFIPNIVTIVFYFLIIFCIGLVAYFSTRSHSDYVLGGRSFGPIITALGVGASDMGGWLMFGLPGAVYTFGLQAIWMPIGLFIGAYINWTLVGKRLRLSTELANDSLTIPSFFSNKFHDHKLNLRLIAASIILVFFTFYSSAGFVAGATLFMHIFDASYANALLISAPIIIIYACVGGFLAVNWVDVMQGFLMLFALLLVPIVTINVMSAGNATFLTQSLAVITDFPHKEIGIIGVISFLTWGLGYFGQPHILVRFMASKTGDTIKIARRICMSWMLLSLIGAIFVGLAGYSYFLNAPLQEPETVFLKLATILFNPWIAGILFSAVLSAIMSSVAAQILLCATAVVEDFYHSVINNAPQEKTLVTLERATVLCVAIMAIIIAYNSGEKILALVGHAWAGLGAAFGPVILYSLFKKDLHARSALFGMVAGAAGVLIWIGLQLFFPNTEIFKLYEIVPGFACAIMAITFSELKING